MNYRILIVDDDDDFRSLLSDLYTQADYQVKSVNNPLDALKLLAEESFSLCVTDQSMPDLKGIDFIEKARTFKPYIPIIMVSAYLSDDQTARLKDQKVEVFHKPLNIMSLLRKTSELIKNASEAPGTTATTSPQVSNTQSQTVESPSGERTNEVFKSFAFKSDAAKRLKKEIESIGDEMPNMVLVGDEGTHFHKICEDIQTQVGSEQHHFVFLVNKKINVFDISKTIADVPIEKTLVFALTEAQHLGIAHKQALMKLHKRTGPFVDIKNQIKFIFCLNEDLDTQFANGAIDQDFYLIMGQKEIYVPRLDLCREDVADLSESIATELASNKSTQESFGGFSSEASELLVQTEWPLNYKSLQSTISSALKLAKGSTVTKDHLAKAIAEPDSSLPVETTSETVSYSDPAPSPISQPTQSSESPKPKLAEEATPRPQQTTPRPRVNQTPMIQSFTMLDDETELAKSLLSKIAATN